MKEHLTFYPSPWINAGKNQQQHKQQKVTKLMKAKKIKKTANS